MKIKLLLLLLLIIPKLTYCQDQIETVDISEVRKNKNQIEIGLRSFKAIWDNTASGTILFKRHFSTGDLVEVNSFKLLRAYFSVNTQINFTDDPTREPKDSTLASFHPSNNINYTIGIGFEKQKKHKSFVNYYGVDLFGQFLKADDDFTNGSFGGVTINTTSSTDRLISTLKTGLNPFIGLKYYFTDQISLGIETGFQVHYFRLKLTELRFEPVVVGQQVEIQLVEKESVVSNGIGIQFNGIRFVTLGYSF